MALLLRASRLKIFATVVLPAPTTPIIMTIIEGDCSGNAGIPSNPLKTGFAFAWGRDWPMTAAGTAALHFYLLV